MKALLLAGGFARRLGDIAEDTPKTLLPLTSGGKAVIDFILDKLYEIDDLAKVFVSTNARFREKFTTWLAHIKPSLSIELVAMAAETEEQKRGPVATIQHVIHTRDIREDLLVLAADNVFDFGLLEFVASDLRGDVVLGAYEVDTTEEARKLGVVEKMDANCLIEKFEEKPPNPHSLLVSIGVWFFPQESLHLVGDFLADPTKECKEPSKPGPGDLIKWLIREDHQVRAFRFRGTWIDMGTPENLAKAKATAASWCGN